MNALIPMRCLLIATAILLAACTRIPQGIQPIDDFELEKYLGAWYEIARLDHSFERGLSNVSATYTLRDDGGVDVLNRGYAAEQQRWEEAQGKAYFVGDAQTGHLKVSFFGPFYSSYIIFELDQNYRYALVSGYNRNYFWILSRTPRLEQDVIDELLAKAERNGFATDALILVEQEPVAQAN